MKYKRLFVVMIFVLFLCVTFLSSCSGKKGESEVVQEVPVQEEVRFIEVSPGVNLPENEKQTTIMVYMVGSNLESGAGAASQDIREMEESGINFEHHNVILYTGGCMHWKNGISGTENTVFQLTGQGKQVIGKTAKAQNMGSPEILLEFLNFSYENFPAEKFVLIFWDHGNGPVFGFGQDENYTNDRLTLSEMEQAFERSPFNGDHCLDWIGFDACMMADIEVAEVFDGYAEYLIASQETMPVTGWDYSFLSEYNHDLLTREIISLLIDYYQSPILVGKVVEESGKTPDLTLSCMKLSYVKDVISAMDKLFEKMNDSLEKGEYYTLARCRDKTKRFGLSAVQNRADSLDLVDIEDMAYQLSELYPEETEELIDVMEKLICMRGSRIDGVYGASVYYPYDSKKNFLAGGETLFDQLLESVHYRKYMENFLECWEVDNKISDELAAELEMDGNWLKFSLPKEKLQDIYSITYSILYQSSDGRYIPLVKDCQVQADTQGLVKINLNQNLFYLLPEIAGAKRFWCVNHLEKPGEKTYYQLYGRLMSDDVEDAAIEGVFVSFHDREEGDWKRQMVIQSILADRNENIHGGKNDVNLQDWQYIAQEEFVSEMDAQEIEIEELLITSKKSRIQSRVQIEKRAAAETSLRLACQVTVKTRFGEEYMLDIYEYEADGLVNEDLRGGERDSLSDSMKLIYSGDTGSVLAVNTDRQEILVRMEEGKGAGTPYAIINSDGYIVISGYEDALWFTDDGYAKILYCESGEETESGDVYEIAIRNREGDVYVALYDWEGWLVEKQKLSMEERGWLMEARNLYPVRYESFAPNFRDLGVTWREEMGGYRCFDSTGAELGFISNDGIDESNLQIHENVIGLWEGSSKCKRIYWINE